jgi:PleD family two-component response regulator
MRAYRGAGAGVVLIVGDDEWTARALAAALEPAGFQVAHAATLDAAQRRLRAAPPDAVVVVARAGDPGGPALCQALRADAAVTAETAIIGVTPAAGGREQRLEWLRAGAWDCLGFPLLAEEVVLKLRRCVDAKRRADRGRAAALVDEATGLYTPRGLRRRVREVLAEAARLRVPVACVAIGTDGGDAALRGRVVRALRAHARMSDVIGWWSGSDLVVLAPGTDAWGAERLAARLAAAIEATSPAAGEPAAAVTVRAGYEALAPEPRALADPDDLLRRASAALGQARIAAPGARIRRFTHEESG